MTDLPPPRYLRSVLDYTPSTGELRWRRSGRLAGTPINHGGVRVMLEGRCVMAHTLIWARQTGSWPASPVRHRDGCSVNNAWDNLHQPQV